MIIFRNFAKLNVMTPKYSKPRIQIYFYNNDSNPSERPKHGVSHSSV